MAARDLLEVGELDLEHDRAAPSTGALAVLPDLVDDLLERVTRRLVDEEVKSASSITFSGPNGWKYSRHIVDPDVLDKVKVGDKIDITWNTDVTVVVQ
jgi:hypothetical protein